jgi:hypothetical protein
LSKTRNVLKNLDLQEDRILKPFRINNLRRVKINWRGIHRTPPPSARRFWLLWFTGVVPDHRYNYRLFVELGDVSGYNRERATA